MRACALCVFSQGAVEAAFADGLNLVEVEFPPLQQDYLEDSGSSAYDVSSANVRLAARFAQSFAADGKVRLFVSWLGLGLAWAVLGLALALAWLGCGRVDRCLRVLQGISFRHACRCGVRPSQNTSSAMSPRKHFMSRVRRHGPSDCSQQTTPLHRN